MKKRTIFGLITLLIAAYILNTLYNANFFKTYDTTANTEVEVVNGPPGLEDITIDHTNGNAFISSHDRRNFNSRGDIYLYKLAEAEAEARSSLINLTAHFMKQDFRPHGISLFIEDDSTKYLFVVCHGNDTNSVERFKIESDSSLQHLDTFTSTEFRSPNDVHAVSATSFYLTNDHDETRGFLRTVKDFLKIGTGSVVYFDANSGKILAKGIPYANGIHTSKDGRKLFVASTSVNGVLVFSRLADNSIIKEATYDTSVGVDNIERDETGNLYIGAHPQLLKFLSHAKDGTQLSPTQLIQITYDERNKSFTQKVIYTDDGSKLSGGSVAAPYTLPNGKQIVLAGGVFDRKLLIVK